jgi:pyruvate dehydrogenase E2 component (dihydrolipoamide acetyltransferase)
MDIKLPKLGEGADSGSVVGILVKAGDKVEAGQTIIELENEKAIAPIPSPVAGVVTQIFVKEGQKISVGQKIIALEEAAGGAAANPAPDGKTTAKAAPAKKAAPAATPPPAVAAPVAAPVVDDGPRNENPAASPSIRKLARDLGIDLTRIHGTERGGRIVMGDLKAYIERLQNLAFAPKPAAAGATAPAPVAESIDFSQFGPVTRKPMSTLRQVIARRMHESSSIIPQVTQFDEADITDLMELRKKFTAKFEAKGARLTLTPFTLKAAVAALRQSPAFNSSLDEATKEIVFKDYYHIGMAVDTEAGLIVPVIRDVDKKTMLQLSLELQSLAERTRQRKVSADEMKGGTFTISNQGAIGGGHFTPIINRPEAAILGLGKSAWRPRVKGDKIVPRLIMPVCVTYDHRLIDGGAAARFIVQIVQALENWKEEQVA